MSPNCLLVFSLACLTGCATQAPQQALRQAPPQASAALGSVALEPHVLESVAPPAAHASGFRTGTDLFALEPLHLHHGAATAPQPALASSAAAFVLDSDEDYGAALPTLPRRKAGDGSSYTLLKGGAFYGGGDLDTLDVDTGWAAEVVFGHELLPFLGLEVSAGYISVDGGVNNFESWAVPLFLQARASLPILILEPYVGVGVGGMYVDASFTGGSFNDFAFAGNAFVGLEVGLGNLAIGAEAKYLASDTIDSATDFSFEGWQGTLFISLPF